MTKGKEYTTDNKEEIRKLSRSGEPITYFRIWAFSKGGTRFHVEIPENELDKADEVLTKKAQSIDAI